MSLCVPCTSAFQYFKYSLIYCVRCRVPVLSKYKTYNCYQALIVNQPHLICNNADKGKVQAVLEWSDKKVRRLISKTDQFITQ